MSSLSYSLGIEGGATRTTMILLDSRGEVAKRVEGGPCNLRLQSDTQILLLWKNLYLKIRKGRTPLPTSVGAFLAGCRVRTDEARILRLLRKLWPSSKCVAGNDALSAMAAALGNQDGIILICGTGSIVRARKGVRSIQIGGWGHIAGDGGSGYWMGRKLLRSIFHFYDTTGSTHSLARSTLRFLKIRNLEALVQWTLQASKHEIASLTKVLFRNTSDPQARLIIHKAVDLLTDNVALASKRLGLNRHPVISINPGIAKYQPLFRKLLFTAIRRKLPKAHLFLSETEGAIGAARLAEKQSKENRRKLELNQNK